MIEKALLAALVLLGVLFFGRALLFTTSILTCAGLCAEGT